MKVSEALSRAASICSGSEKCASDIKKKLKSWELSEEQANEVIDKLIAEKFIDHERFTGFYVRDKFKFNKWGKRKIEFELRNKGIESRIIHEALNTIPNDDYLMTLSEILEQKLRAIRNKDQYQTKAALIRFASSRGFESDIIFSVIDKIIKP